MEAILLAIVVWIKAHLGWILITICGSGIGGLLGVVLKKFIPKDAITKNFDAWILSIRKKFNDWMDSNKGWIRTPFRVFGNIMTRKGTALPVVGPVWNAIIEPYVIFFVDLLGKGLIFIATLIFDFLLWLIQQVLEAFKNGLMSDNPNFKGERKVDTVVANQEKQ
jgi:hypothetical protein